MIRKLLNKLTRRKATPLGIADLLNQFINGVWLKNARGEQVWVAIGLSNDYDGYFGAQCMDLALYWAEYLGLPLLSAPSALNTWNLNPDPAKWQKIPYQSGLLPQPGDLTVWGTYMGSAGHIDIVVDQISSNGFRGVDENWFNSNGTVGSPAAYVNHTYAGVLGWFRPVVTVVPQTKPVPAAICSSDS